LSDALSDFIPILLFIGLIALRWWLGKLIGEAALRRGSGYMGWIICSLIFGPLIVWIVYLIFVHWKPTNFGIPYESEEDTVQSVPPTTTDQL
jgi:hypothetical protein